MAPVTKSERNKNEIQEKQNLGSPLHFNLVTFNENFSKTTFSLCLNLKQIFWTILRLNECMDTCKHKISKFYIFC